MARRQTEGMSVSLFPFLSILACIIGTLTLMIAGMTCGTMSSPQSPEDDPALKLQETVAQAIFVQNLLGIRTEHPNPGLRKEELEQQIAELKKQLAEMKAALGETEIPKKPMVTLEPSGSAENADAFFVDCTEHAIVLQPERTQIGEVESDQPRIFQTKLEELIRIRRESTRVLKADIPLSQSLREFLERVRSRSGGEVVFLIRPDGVKTFKEAEKLVRSMGGIRYGYLPVPGHGKIDFSLFPTGD